VKQAIASLEKEKILGFVLNHIQFKSSGLSSRYFGSDGYYYRYGYGYDYGHGRGVTELPESHLGRFLRRMGRSK